MTVASARTEPRKRTSFSTVTRVPAPACRSTTLGFGLFLLLALTAPAAGSETSAAEPGSRLTVGVEERVRTENWDNLFDFDSSRDDTRHQWRFRTRLWSQLQIGSKHEIAIGLDNENRRITTPDTDFSWDEVIFETLYLDSKITPSASIRIGRQNLTRNDGFLIFEGGPLDGSRSIYSNAVQASYARGTSKLAILAVSNPSRDEYLPRINDKDRLLVEWDELALGLAYTYTGLPATTIEGSYYWKSESDDVRPATDPQRQPDRNLHTFGGRYGRELAHGLSLAVEAAGQLGSQDPDTAIRAWCSRAKVAKEFEHASKPSLALVWVGLSGDDPGTQKIEGWDPLLARWPLWSELYIYTLASERGVAYWTNLAMGRLQIEITPWKPLQVRGSYSRLGAFQAFPGDPQIEATGELRGDLFELRVDAKMNDSLRGHLLGEWFEPGSFYAGADGAWFLRAEIIASYTHLFRF